MKHGRISFFFLLFMAFAMPGLARAQAPAMSGEVIASGIKLKMHSTVLGEDRPYWVYVPPSYCDERYAPRHYPVLYVLDGDAHFLEAAGMTQYMSAGINANFQIPEMIIVAIPNTGHRTRDLTPNAGNFSGNDDQPKMGGGGAKFLKFLATELIPEIDRTYRTQQYRVIVGHSFGANLAIYSMFARPDLFQGYVTIDPGSVWGNEYLRSFGLAHLPPKTDNPPGVYMSTAGTMDENGIVQKLMLGPNERFRDFMEGEAAPYFRFQYQHFPIEDHGSMPIPSLYYGLLHVFAGFKPTYAQKDNAASLQAHFAKVSKSLGFQYLPPEQMMDRFGENGMKDKNYADAQTYFALNAENYPESRHALSQLARVYDLEEKAQAAQEVRAKMAKLPTRVGADIVAAAPICRAERMAETSATSILTPTE